MIVAAFGAGTLGVAPSAWAAEGDASRSDVTFEGTAPEDGAGSSVEVAGSTEAPGSSGEVAGSTEAPSSSGEVAGTTEAPDSSGEVAGSSTNAPGSSVEVAETTDASASSRRRRRDRTPRARRDGPLWRYLARPVRMSPHHVDHGVLHVAVAGGWPHRYRLELALGLLDHLTLGVTGHWLPGQETPQLSPVVAIAFYRNRLFETGVRHFWSLYPPPADDFDPATPSYPGLAQWTLAHASFGQAWLTGGFDAGVVRARVDDPGEDPDSMGNNPSTKTVRFGGGLHLRAGTRRWGFTAQVLVPQVFAELRFDVRFGLFERRPKGGWRPSGVVEDWDRPSPF